MDATAFGPQLRVSQLPAVSVWWQALSSQCRSSLEREDLATVAILRNALDGSYQDVQSLLMKCGGLAEDVPFLRDIWKSLESSARSELRRLGNTPTAEATAAAIISGRKRQVPVPSQAHDSAASTESVAPPFGTAWPVRLNARVCWRGTLTREPMPSELIELCGCRH